MINLSEDCIFISDAHYNEYNQQLYNVLRKEKSSMIIFMGDIFDFLFGSVKQSIEDNQELIYLINELSLHKEIIYLEGNHDFNLKKIFPNIKVYPISQQPLIVAYKGKRIALAHGDIGISRTYGTYTKIIRNKYVLRMLNCINITSSKKMLNTIKKRKEKKNKCYEIENFENIAYARMENYIEDYIIEGHFHQDKTYKMGNKTYINLPAFICSKDIKKIKDLIN